MQLCDASPTDAQTYNLPPTTYKPRYHLQPTNLLPTTHKPTTYNQHLPPTNLQAYLTDHLCVCESTHPKAPIIIIMTTCVSVTPAPPIPKILLQLSIYPGPIPHMPQVLPTYHVLNQIFKFAPHFAHLPQAAPISVPVTDPAIC